MKHTPIYPVWVCHDCGLKYQPRKHNELHITTFHVGDPCGWCGRNDIPVTEPRDYGYPVYPPPSDEDQV